MLVCTLRNMLAFLALRRGNSCPCMCQPSKRTYMPGGLNMWYGSIQDFRRQILEGLMPVSCKGLVWHMLYVVAIRKSKPSSRKLWSRRPSLGPVMRTSRWYLWTSPGPVSRRLVVAHHCFLSWSFSPTQKLIYRSIRRLDGTGKNLACQVSGVCSPTCSYLHVVTLSTLQKCNWTATSGSGYIKHWNRIHNGMIIPPEVIEVKKEKESEEQEITEKETKR